MNESVANKILTEIMPVPVWSMLLDNEEHHIYNYVQLLEDIQNSEMTLRTSNVGGWQSKKNLHKEPVFRELVRNIEKISQNIMYSFSEKKVKINEMWANINDKYDYNTHHVHEGILSGTFYLQVPDKSGDLVFVNPVVRSQTSIIRPSDVNITPQKLVCIIFPSWLEHYVQQNQSNDKRISISFNIGE